MAKDLELDTGQSVVLGTSPSGELSESFEEIRIDSLEDLVEHDFVGSRDLLRELLRSARDATREALETGGRWDPRREVGRPDLGRFGRYIGGARDIRPPAARGFWRIVRDINPTVVASVGELDEELELAPLDRHLSSLGDALRRLRRYAFADVTVAEGSTLEVEAGVDQLLCDELLIKQDGQIRVHGSALHIKATSIEGR